MRRRMQTHSQSTLFQPPSGLGFGERNRNRTICSALVDAIRQQQRGIRTLFKIVDGPSEMDIAVKLAEFRRVVRPEVSDPRTTLDTRSEITEFHPRRSARD